MKKRALSFFLTLCMSFTLITSAFSAEPTLNCASSTDEEVSYDRYTITFDLPLQQLSLTRTDADVLQYEQDVVLPHNQRAAKTASEYVKSLGLSSHNLSFIEESCLSELDAISGDSDYVLTSYTVLVPQGGLSTQSNYDTMPLSELSYYGTYANQDFYFYTFSESEQSTEYKRVSNRMQAFFDSLINLFLCFGPAEVTVPATILKSEFPTGYTPNSQAYCEYYFNVNIRTRGIYTKYYVASTGSYRYDMVTSQQYGHLYPFLIYHPVDSPTYKGAYVYDLGWQGAAHTPHYSDKDWQLQNAYNVFHGSLINVNQKVMDYSTSYYWG